MSTTKEYDFLDRLTAISSSNSQLLSSFLWGLDLSGSPQGAGGVGSLLAVSDQSTINSQPSSHFVSYDGNGNVAALVNAADGTPSASYEYGPFGELIRASGLMAKANPLRFSTKYQDDESDLLYYGYRSYNPSVGRWLSRDPIGERGGGNLYGLPHNNAVTGADPLGLCGCRVFVPLKVELTPPNNPAIFDRFPVAGGPADNPIWDGSWDGDGDGTPDGDVRIWFVMRAVFNKCCEFRQEAKGRHIVDGKVRRDQPSFQDDGYNRATDPGAYHDLGDDKILFADWDNPGVGGPVKSVNLWNHFKGYILDVCPDSPTYNKKIGGTKEYGFFVAGPPGSKVSTWGFD